MEIIIGIFLGVLAVIAFGCLFNVVIGLGYGLWLALQDKK